jgi:hypothetical protein
MDDIAPLRRLLVETSAALQATADVPFAEAVRVHLAPLERALDNVILRQDQLDKRVAAIEALMGVGAGASSIEGGAAASTKAVKREVVDDGAREAKRSNVGDAASSSTGQALKREPLDGMPRVVAAAGVVGQTLQCLCSLNCGAYDCLQKLNGKRKRAEENRCDRVPEDGSDFCAFCECSKPGCHHVRNRTVGNKRFCHAHGVQFAGVNLKTHMVGYGDAAKPYPKGCHAALKTFLRFSRVPWVPFARARSETTSPTLCNGGA